MILLTFNKKPSSYSAVFANCRLVYKFLFEWMFRFNCRKFERKQITWSLFSQDVELHMGWKQHWLLQGMAFIGTLIWESVGKIPLLVLCDQFVDPDTVHHSILLGIQCSVLKWIYPISIDNSSQWYWEKKDWGHIQTSPYLLFFSIYMTPFSDVILQFRVWYNQYVDIQLYISTLDLLEMLMTAYPSACKLLSFGQEETG